MMFKSVLCFVALIWVAAAVPHSAPCPRNDDPNGLAILFADRANCAAFYECSHGEAYRYFCPDQLYYDIPLKTCNYKANVKCGWRPEPDEAIPYDS